MSTDVVDLLEFIQIDVEQPEKAGLNPRLLNQCVQMLVEGEAVVDAGKQVELRAVEKLGEKPSGFDSEGCQRGGNG